MIRLTARELIDELKRELARGGEDPRAMVAAFDADGTLWTTDVGEDLFAAALRRQVLRDAALPALVELAARYNVPDSGDANELAARLAATYRDGTMPERDYAEMLVWCYAGMRRAQWWDFARDTLNGEYMERTLNAPALQVLQWAQAVGMRCLAISASPQAAVEVAIGPLGIPARDVIAGRPAVDQHDVLLPRMAQPLPWGEQKARAGRDAVEGAAWFITLGDSAFDVAMLKAARRPVAVRPKPELRERFAEFGDAPLVELL